MNLLLRCRRRRRRRRKIFRWISQWNAIFSFLRNIFRQRREGDGGERRWKRHHRCISPPLPPPPPHPLPGRTDLPRPINIETGWLNSNRTRQLIHFRGFEQLHWNQLELNVNLGDCLEGMNEWMNEWFEIGRENLDVFNGVGNAAAFHTTNFPWQLLLSSSLFHYFHLGIFFFNALLSSGFICFVCNGSKNHLKLNEKPRFHSWNASAAIGVKYPAVVSSHGGFWLAA